jgi:hypothetical protein
MNKKRCEFWAELKSETPFKEIFPRGRVPIKYLFALQNESINSDCYIVDIEYLSEEQLYTMAKIACEIAKPKQISVHEAVADIKETGGMLMNCDWFERRIFTPTEIVTEATLLPLYWQDESSGKLRESIDAYFNNTLNPELIARLQFYFRQWINSSVWELTDKILDLRESVDAITTKQDIDRWVESASLAGVDPL